MTQHHRERANFIKKLQLFYIRDCGNGEDIKRLDYVFDDEAESEFVYVSYESYSQRRFSIKGDSKDAILKDFADFLSDAQQRKYFWLIPSDPAFKEELLEDE